MMKKLSIRDLEFRIDLATVEGDGSFQCPKCGMQISPDDETRRYKSIGIEKVSKVS